MNNPSSTVSCRQLGPGPNGDPWLVMLPGRQPQFHIELFGAHLISNEEFRVAQRQAGLMFLFYA